MNWFYPVVFWFVWVSLPSLCVGYWHWSWVRGLTVAAAVVLAPFVLTLALAAWGTGGAWANAVAVDAWLKRCVDVGASVGYALGILVPLAVFRYRDTRCEASPSGATGAGKVGEPAPELPPPGWGAEMRVAVHSEPDATRETETGAMLAPRV